MSTIQEYQEAFMNGNVRSPQKSEPNSKLMRSNAFKDKNTPKNILDHCSPSSKSGHRYQPQFTDFYSRGNNHTNDFGNQNSANFNNRNNNGRSENFFKSQNGQFQNKNKGGKENIFNEGPHALLREKDTNQDFLPSQDSDNINMGLEKFFGRRNQVREKIMKNQTLIRHINALGGIENTFESKN